MVDNDGNGNFKADIPEDAIADALRSVEGAEAAAAGEGDEVRKLRAMLDDSAQRAAQTQERLKETHERMLRVAADFENFKKRSVKDRDDAVKFGNERLLKDLIPVLDNLERAVATGGEGQALVEGVRLVARQFSDVLSRHGVKSFSAVGAPFDPNVHEALMQQESADAAPGTVLAEMVKGYTLNERLVRPAAVVVAKAPERASAPPPEAAAGEGEGGTVH